MTATSISPYALTADYDSDSGHVWLSTYENNVSVFIQFILNANGTLRMDSRSSLVHNSKVFQQLKGYWYTVLAGNINICLYYIFGINNVSIYLSFDNIRQE